MSQPEAGDQAIIASLEHAKIGYALVTRSGQVTNHNSVFTDHTGLVAKASGAPWFERDFAPSATIKARAALWARILRRGKVWHGVVRWYTAPGEILYFEGTAVPQESGDFVLITNDRTDRIMARRRASETEATQKEILAVLPLVLCVAREDHIVEYLNDALPARLGLPVTELVGKKVGQVFGPGLEAKAEEVIDKVTQTGEPLTLPTIEVCDGVLVGTHWRVSAHPFDKNKAGQRRVLVTAVDRTDSIRLRNERIRFAESIAETQKIEAINSFAGSLAHELSNLMQPISGYAKLLAGKVSDEQQKEYLARINQATLAAGRILRRTLSMSYGNSSSEARTDISTLVDETIQAARDLAPDGLIYETNLGQGLTAACPSGELRQVLLNVLNNAAEAMHYSGTVRVSLTFEQSPPDGNDLLPPGEPPFVHLTIEDEGPGLSPDVQGRLFDPFFTTKRVGRGTGLGLAVAQGLTTGWGGLITADNRTTGGARFDIWIPAIDG